MSNCKYCEKEIKSCDNDDIYANSIRSFANKNNQDKISFCIEKLEKVKELLYPELRFDYSLYLRVTHEIDNQIKQLKENRNENKI